MGAQVIPAAGCLRPGGSQPSAEAACWVLSITDQLRTLVRDGNVTHIARASGVERTKLHHWLAGKVALRLHEAEAVAKACGKSLRLT